MPAVQSRVHKKTYPQRIFNNSAKKLYFHLAFSGPVEVVFLNKISKIHAKIITRSKVMKVPTKSLKNASEQHEL